MRQYDILIVGGGPAGLSSAIASANKGVKTLLIDKKEEIGIPIQCAEGIGTYLFPYLPFQIPQNQLLWKIDGMSFWVDDISIERKSDWWKGYTVDRRKFDKWLYKLAADNGAEIWTNTELIDLEFYEENNVKKAIVKKEKKSFEIAPKVVIAADGAESIILKLLGLYKPKNGDIAKVYSWEMSNLNLYNSHIEQIYLGEFSPSGYAYIFPKSKNRANFGIGHIYPKKDLDKYFYEFLELNPVKKQVKNAKFVVEKSGKVTIGHIVDQWVYGNILLVGDSANQNLKPFVEGILPSIICGNVAGNFAYNMVKKKSENMNQYKESVERKLYPYFEFSNDLINILKNIYAMKEKKKHLLFYGLVSNIFNPEELPKLEKLNYKQLKNILMTIKETE